MNRFFVDKNYIDDNKVEIYGDDVKHIKNVLRLKIGDKISICDGQNNEYIAKICNINKTLVLCDIISKCDISRESNIKITLFQALTKGQKMDLIIQKAVELGVYQIYPVQMKRCVSKITDLKKENKKVERWNRIAYEAAKQSKRGFIPKINEVISFMQMTELFNAFDNVIVPYENEKDTGIKDVLKNINTDSICVIIGPEGGFEEEEIQILEKKNSSIVTLGPRILRTETAGFVTISAIMYELGDLG
ncbi:16S rRNA (uracil(1498)-N(3))-methyltransferase [Abyssisolibacter fermentans]|uniref:16S rRNA (uracil(1498)-N(3))-methyltransferase n=1 Tax=Abyssisolibacter fermentans TaxID=1766203 RepID=UPI000831C4B8|nr:16S rRNA (uracil(1498)-N(3))-methyltransferase [Abyssisolibacter fermentans]